MKVPSIIVFTHDSIGVGEDGPTHQPVEPFRITEQGIEALPADNQLVCSEFCAQSLREETQFVQKRAS